MDDSQRYPLELSLILLAQLSCYERQGRNDSDDADNIRDQLDPLWKAMSEDDREIHGQISELLYKSSNKAKSKNAH